MVRKVTATPAGDRRARMRGVAVALASVTVLSGCAAHGRHFTSRFVKPGEPTASFGAAAAAPPQESLADYTRRLRALQANARTKSSVIPTIESRDPTLAAALLRLSMYESAENHRLVGEAYRNAGVSDYAYKHLHRAVQLDQCDSAAYEGLARVWRDWGLPDLALGDAYRAVHCRPQSASAYNTLGTVMAALGQLKNARKAFEFALMLDGRAVFALNNLCYLALQEGNGAAAQRACEHALALEPAMSAARNNLALAYALQGDVSGAEKRLFEARDPAQANYNVGVLRMSLGKYTEAAHAFDQALQAKPSLWIAQQRAVQARHAAAALEQDHVDR